MTPEEIKKDWEVVEAFKAHMDDPKGYLNPFADGLCINFISISLNRWPEALREIQVLMGRCELMKKTLEQIKDLKEHDSTFLVTGIACIGLAVDSVFKKECQ